jgi:hypothetical protein
MADATTLLYTSYLACIIPTTYAVITVNCKYSLPVSFPFVHVLYTFMPIEFFIILADACGTIMLSSYRIQVL